MFPYILEGSQKAMRECQTQFSSHRWNCSDNRRSLKRVLSRGVCEGVQEGGALVEGYLGEGMRCI